MLNYIYKMCMVKVSEYIRFMKSLFYLMVICINGGGKLLCVQIERGFVWGDFLSYCAYCLHLCLDYR